MPPVKMKGTAKPKDTKKVILRILSYMGSFKALWVVVFLCVLLSSFAELAGSYVIKPILNDYIIPLINQDNPDFSSLAYLLMKVGFIFALGAIANWGNARFMLYISTNLLCKIRKDLFNRLQELPIKFYDQHPHGELMSRFSSDTDTLRDMLSQTVPQLISSSITVLGVSVMMLILSPILTAIIIITIFFMLILVKKIGKRSAESFRAQQSNIGKLNGFVEEMIEGQKVVKVFAHERDVIDEFNILNDNLRDSGTRANSYANVLGPTMNNLGHVQYALISIIGAFFVIINLHDIGTVAAFLQYTRNFSRPISMISQLFNSILNALAGAERIFAIIDEEPESNDGRIKLVNAYRLNSKEKDEQGKLVQAYAFTGEWAWKDSANNRLTPLRGEIIFDNVSFGYKKEKDVLHNISLHAYQGQKIALVGSTGSGKTTITNLLTRFFDVEENKGKILFDNIPINQISKSDLRRSLGMVLQDTHLFTGSILENIRYGNPEASKVQVQAAAKLANADSFIKNLPNGYDTVITGDGESLSQGQRQLLSIARAAISNPPILILDEATSSVDTRTEMLIQEGMDRLMEGRTVFVIAHRLSTVRNADEILVLEHGSIIERGNHDELMSQRGRYYELCSGGLTNLN